MLGVFNNPPQGTLSALQVSHTQGYTIVIAEIELRNIPMQMLLRRNADRRLSCRVNKDQPNQVKLT